MTKEITNRMLKLPSGHRPGGQEKKNLKNKKRKDTSNKMHARTDQVLDPGIVSWWADGHLYDGGCDEHNQTQRGDVLPQVEIDYARSETQHVLQVLHEPDGERTTEMWTVMIMSHYMILHLLNTPLFQFYFYILNCHSQYLFVP